MHWKITLGLNAKRIEILWTLVHRQCTRGCLNAKRIEILPIARILFFPWPCLNAKRIEIYPPSPVHLPYHYLVSMQRGLKFSYFSHSPRRLRRSLNAKRIEIQLFVTMDKTKCISLNAKRIEISVSLISPANATVVSQCKEDWNTLRRFPGSWWAFAVSMQRGLKSFSSFLPPFPPCYGLNAKRIEILEWLCMWQGQISPSQCKEDWNTALRLYPGHLSSEVSMQRGLKLMSHHHQQP